MILKHHDIQPVRKDQIGIMPIGALSIAFASYVQAVDTFIESGKKHYRVGEKIKIDSNKQIKEILLTKENYIDNILIFDGRMPEVILFSPPNHRLISVLDELINMISIELSMDKNNTNKYQDINKYIPKFVMLSNGIYYDEIMIYITKSFSSLDENIREEIKGHFIRATTLQTGTRMENGIFKPGTKGSVTIADGHINPSRERVITLFKKYNYPVVEMEDEVRRIEFDKAIVNLSTNAVQLSLLFDDKSNIRNLYLGDIVSDKKMRMMCKRIIYNMTSIGVKSGIYKNKDMSQKQLIDTIYQEKWKKIEEISKIENVHIVSSIATVIERYRKGKLEGKPLRLPPLEENIINYLLNLSKENNLDKEMVAIEELRDSILHVCGKVWC